VTPSGGLPFDPIDEARRQWVEHGWEAAADGVALVTSVMRVQQLYLGRIDAVLRPFDLTFARFELLTLLSFTRSGALPMSKAGARLQVHPTSVTNAVDRLEAQGYVERLPHPTDRRTTLVSILPQGRQVQAEAIAALNDQAFVIPGVEGGDARALYELLRQVRSSFDGDFEA
jgi:DNA-binding MarR family transcriptional regulator